MHTYVCVDLVLLKCEIDFFPKTTTIKLIKHLALHMFHNYQHNDTLEGSFNFTNGYGNWNIVKCFHMKISILLLIINMTLSRSIYKGFSYNLQLYIQHEYKMILIKTIHKEHECIMM